MSEPRWYSNGVRCCSPLANSAPLTDWKPSREGPTMTRRAKRTDRPVHVAFIDDLGYEVPADDVASIPTGN